MPDISVDYILEMGQFNIQKVQGAFPWILSSLKLAIYWIIGLSRDVTKPGKNNTCPTDIR